MDKLKKQIYEKVKEWESQRQWISRIHEKLCRNLQQEVPIELIREILSEIREARKQAKSVKNDIDSKTKEKENGGLRKMVKEVWDDKKFDYDEANDMIIFYPEWKPHWILRTTVEAMFEKYVRYGENLSWKEMQIEFELTPKVWLFIKNVMNLYKDSTPFDIITLRKIKSEDDMERIAQEKADRLTEWNMKRVYEKSVINKKERALKRASKELYAIDYLMQRLEDVIKKYTPRDFNNYKVPELKNNNTKDVFITDAHFGKNWTDWIVVRFKKLTRSLIESPEKNINITFGGDLWELFLPIWEMHPWQRLGMEEITTEDLIMLIVDVFEQMLLELHKAGKKVIFNGMWWNHDRFTERKEFDPNRTPAMIVYRFLQKIVENTNIKINILRDKANVIKSGKVKYVFLHWDWLSPAELNRRALQEKEDGFYLCIVSWDKHSFKMTELASDILWIQSPALAWQGKYDKSLALTSLPWHIEFIKNSDGLVDLMVKRYK